MSTDTKRERALDQLCRTLVGRLEEVARVAAPGTPQDDIASAVVSVFASVPHNTVLRRRELGDAFQRLDERPSWYGNGQHSQQWHSCLRITRNHRTACHELFALWS